MCVLWTMLIREFKNFMAVKYTFVRPSISNNNTKHTRHTETGTCECMHASAPKKSANLPQAFDTTLCMCVVTLPRQQM